MNILCKLLGHKWKLVGLYGLPIKEFPYGGMLIERYRCKRCGQVKGEKE